MLRLDCLPVGVLLLTGVALVLAGHTFRVTNRHDQRRSCPDARSVWQEMDTRGVGARTWFADQPQRGGIVHAQRWADRLAHVSSARQAELTRGYRP